MHQTLGVLVGVPLQMTDQARVVIDYAKPDGRDPFALAVEDLQRALVAIEVKQCTHVRGLEAAHLAGAIGHGGAPRSTSGLALAPQTLGTEVAQYGCIGWQWRGRGRGRALRCSHQVVVVQLNGPFGMVRVLHPDRCTQRLVN